MAQYGCVPAEAHYQYNSRPWFCRDPLRGRLPPANRLFGQATPRAKPTPREQLGNKGLLSMSMSANSRTRKQEPKLKKPQMRKGAPFPGGLDVEAALAEVTKRPMGSAQGVRL